ncbi:hypothetical protein [Streptomyces sp. RK62]|uniref:hypothetical protein n=1 Tax=Streptomyces sp. RK62 TaxID=2824893 RepID=UPI001B35F1F4|nr:hypothetical protein [Streptomyces sp. RK62]MBQ1000348.1 hypothetical protein [Streptomyces sp. RK62]
MTDFAQYDGFKRDFDFYVGPARPDGFRTREFGDRLWADVSRLLGVPFDGASITPGVDSGYKYWFENEDLSASVYSGPLEGSGVLDQVPASLNVISRSMDVANSELAERLYAGLTASDDAYLVVVFEDTGMPIAANYDIGNDW